MSLVGTGCADGSRGVWDSIPAEAKIVKPDLLIVPVVGFDRACYRLGYGGGYYDRTLAGRAGAVFTVGVGFALLEVDTILPQQHDVPLDRIVTEDAVYEAPL
ncbi:5-formyltetrahydrofolate cyclo-ligase [Acidipila sp. EB88]|nr:5-formyltetrahydrofolate cyclo-ligase [Acidipila sp. EB88]